MSPGTWERLKESIRVIRPKFFGVKDVAAHTRPPRATQSETRGYSSPEIAATLPVHRPSEDQKVSHSLTCGQTVAGRFRILRFINSGGMGEVFDAWDSELSERVALKTIRPEIASFSSVIDHFKQEVRQARAISHVNVCRVYEVFNHVQGSGEHIWFLTMELLTGQTLAERLHHSGPIQPKEALELVEQMVAGLAAAHEHGVVHRDFKSSNVILVDNPSGKTRVVVTDFGLAHNILTGKHTYGEDSKEGTPRYMAPEQIRGDQVGFTADQYALGAVMCEMLTGQCPARPEQASERVKALLPPGHKLNPRWENVIRRCLEFRPEDRFPSIRDVASALNPTRPSKTAWILGAVVASSLIFSLVALRSRGAGDRVEAAWQLTPDTDLTSRPSLSRDGTMIAYSSDRAESGNLDIWVQHLPTGMPRRLTANPAEDLDPNLAPDGSAVIFRSERDGGGIYMVEAAGGNERLLAPHGRNPRFSPDGRSVAYWVGDDDATIASGQLFLLSLKDGKSVRLAEDFADARYPAWSSDGRHILFSGCQTRTQPMPGCSEWWVTTRDNTYVKDTGTVTLLRKNNVQVIDLIGDWYGDKVLFSGRQESAFSLWAVSLPQSTLHASGKPHQLTPGEARAVAPSVAENGEIAFEHFTAAIHIWRIQHASDPSTAAAAKVTHDPTMDISPNISSNGIWLVLARGYASKRNIWIEDMRTGSEDLFFSAPGDRLSPIVDDSGQNVVFEAREKDFPTLVATTRGGSARLLRAGCSNPTGWFDENHSVFCREGIPSKIEMVDLATGTARVVLEKKGLSLSEATWSPDNQYLLFTASPDGTSKQVFAVSFSRSSRIVKGNWIPITEPSGFSDRPRWSGDGKTVFYLSKRDGFPCVWGQRFDPESEQLIAAPFPVTHYHNRRFSPEAVVDRSFNLSVAGDSVYLNVAEINTSVWVGRLTGHSVFSF
jgi:eukaryotic-like serine/threonine-protein kinase